MTDIVDEDLFRAMSPADDDFMRVVDPQNTAVTADMDYNMFQHFYDRGFVRLLPIIPPNAPIRDGSKLDRGKTPGCRGEDGIWYGLKDFTRRVNPTTPDEIRTWYSWGASVGILAAANIEDAEGYRLAANNPLDLVALDLDIDDGPLAAALKGLAKQHLGAAPCRGRGNSTRCLLLYDLEGDSFGKHRIVFEKRDVPSSVRSNGAVEILCRGNQFLAWGPHKDGSQYHWDDHWEFKDLTQVTLEQIRTFSAAAQKMLTALGFETKGSEIKTATATRGRKAAADFVLDHPYTWARALRHLKHHEGAVENAGGYHHTCDLAQEIMDIGLSPAKAADAMLQEWNARCNPPWDETKLHEKVESLAQSRENDIGCDYQPPRTAFEVFKSYQPANELEGVSAKSQERFLCSVSDLLNWPDPEELVENFIMQGENVCLYGPPKHGKTHIALDTSLSVAANVPVFGKLDVVKSGPVIYLSGEGHAGMKRRIRAWLQRRAVSADQIEGRFFYKTEVPHTAKGIEECQRYIDGIRAQVGCNSALIVIDTMARSMSGLNENDAGDMGRFLNLTEGLRQSLKCPVLTLAHSGKDVSRGIRGSSNALAGFDAVWEVEKNDDTKVVQLRAKWTKDANPDELGPFCFKLSPETIAGMVKNNVGVVLEMVPLGEFNDRARHEDREPHAKANVIAALHLLKAYGRENGRPTEMLVKTLSPQDYKELDEDYKHRCRSLAKQLSKRTATTYKDASKSLLGYAHKGQGPGGTTLWYLPIEARLLPDERPLVDDD